MIHRFSLRRLVSRVAVLLIAGGAYPQFSIPAARAADFGPQILISVPDQALAIVEGEKLLGRYRVSTSRFGTGDDARSYKTPLGKLFVCYKIGDGFKEGTVLKGRSRTGEVVNANAPGRDPIVTRVIWLRGLEDQNKRAFERCIYIHGTPDERNLGKQASFGCIRMRSKDVISVYQTVTIGTQVTISDQKLAQLVPHEKAAKFDLRFALMN